jgi:hypothetical protein
LHFERALERLQPIVRLLNMKPRGSQPFRVQQATVAVVLDEQYGRAVFGRFQSGSPAGQYTNRGGRPETGVGQEGAVDAMRLAPRRQP